MISMIWAQGLDRTIGINNDIPWHVPEDFAHFKKQTMNSIIVMGRNTWESLPKKPLPKRRNIVLTTDENYIADGAETIASINKVLEYNAENPDANIWIIGGGKVYESFMKYADRIIVTEIGYENNDENSVKAPILDPNKFILNDSSERLISKKSSSYQFFEYVRIKKSSKNS